MSDDESTRPIDLDALRAEARRSKPDVDPAEDAPTAAGLPLPPLEPLGPLDADDDQPASATRLDIALPAATPAEDSGQPTTTSWVTQRDIPIPVFAQQSLTVQLPRKVAPEELAGALEELGRTDEQPALSSESTPAALPAPRFGFDEAEVTNVTGGFTLDGKHPADESDSTAMGRIDNEGVRAAFAAAVSAEETAVYRGPIPDVGAPVPAPPETPRTAVAPAAASSSSVLELDGEDLESVPEIEDLDATGEGELPRFALDDGEPEIPPPAPVPASLSAVLAASPAPPPVTAEMPAAANDLDAPTAHGSASDSSEVMSVLSGEAEIVSFTGSNASPSQNSEVLSVRSGEAEIVDSTVDPSTESMTRAGPRRAPSMRPPSASVRPPSASVRPPVSAVFVPPAPIGKPIAPAYAIDPDDEERRLQEEGRFRELADLYRGRLAGGETPSARAAILNRLASVLEGPLDRPDDAFETLLQAFDMRPTDDDVAQSLDRVGRRVSRIGEIADRAIKALHSADPETKVALLAHIIYWYERCLGRGSEIGRFVSELERLDKAHPIVLRRQAQVAGSNGDLKTQRDLLQRAYDRTTRRDEKVSVLLALASAHAGLPDAVRFYETAVAVDPTSINALQGLERIGREQEKHGQVEWSLERQAEIAPTTSEKVDAWLKLAELQETKFLRRERAAELYERVLEDEPANPTALRALERCYHALREWAKLARILRARAENTYDKKAQVELLQTAAEVHESKLGDSEGAVEAYKDLLLAEPTHRRALTDLARLTEKVGDWGAMATYKSKLAELAPTKREAARLFLQLGDMLAAPERDPIAARMQYERAVGADPTNTSAWEALQRMAAAAGDERRVISCLVERARHTESTRQRAQVLVELANVHASRGELQKSRDAFANAIRCDATNEAAATAMLEIYAQEERWKEAAPLCELLVNAATRDKDLEALFTRLRLQTRIAAALGDAEKAMTASLAALEARPDDPDAQADLLAVTSQVKNAPQILARAKPWLSRIASAPEPLPPDAMLRLALVQRETGDLDGAATTLGRVLEQDPDSPDVQKELAEVYLAQGDFPHACKLIVDRARNAITADQKFDLLVQAGEIWARRADELEKAATVFEEARLIKPLDRGLLHTLMWLYGELADWNRLSNVLEGIVQIQETPERQAKSLFAMAQVVRDKIGDAARAAELLDQVLDIDRKRLDAFEELVRTLTAAKDWEHLERSYRKMIARIKDDDEPRLRFALFQQLGLVYRDRLGDAERAYEALEAAGRIRPDDTEVRKIVTELLVVTDNIDNAVQRTRELVARDPHKASLYAELYDLFLRQAAYDKAWCALDVLARFQDLNAEQGQFLDDYPPIPLHEVPGQLVEPAWHSHILHPDLNPRLTSLFAIMTPAVARMRHAQLRPEQRVGRPFTPNQSPLYEAIRQTFANAAEILAMRPPDLLLGDPASTVPFAPALAPFGAVLVATGAAEARHESLAYVVGKRLAEQRLELAARAFFPSIPDLTGLLAAAVRVSRQEGARDPAAAQLDAALLSVLTPQERGGIQSIVMQTAMEGGVVDVKRWLQAADLSSMRAGLLVTGHVEPARKAIMSEPVTAADLPPRERVGELYKFAVSDTYSDLRGAIGIAVQG